MKQYKLVNENRGDEIIAMLEKILVGDIYNKLDKTPKLLTKIFLKTLMNSKKGTTKTLLL